MPGEPLWVYAAPREGAPWADHPRAFAMGVGKVAATLSLTQRLQRDRPSSVIVFGVAGSHPGGPAVGEPCLVTADWLADEGVQTPDGFLTLESLNLGHRGPLVADPTLTDDIDEAMGGGVARVVGATVSTCSGSDLQRKRHRAACPDAVIETMEGAAVGAVCAALGIRWAQLRVVSNRTGDRERAGWDLDGALDRLHAAVHRLITAVA